MYEFGGEELADPRGIEPQVPGEQGCRRTRTHARIPSAQLLGAGSPDANGNPLQWSSSSLLEDEETAGPEEPGCRAVHSEFCPVAARHRARAAPAVVPHHDAEAHRAGPDAATTSPGSTIMETVRARAPAIPVLTAPKAVAIPAVLRKRRRLTRLESDGCMKNSLVSNSPSCGWITPGLIRTFGCFSP